MKKNSMAIIGFFGAALASLAAYELYELVIKKSGVLSLTWANGPDYNLSQQLIGSILINNRTGSDFNGYLVIGYSDIGPSDTNNPYQVQR